MKQRSRAGITPGFRTDKVTASRAIPVIQSSFNISRIEGTGQSRRWFACRVEGAELLPWKSPRILDRQPLSLLQDAISLLERLRQSEFDLVRVAAGPEAILRSDAIGVAMLGENMSGL